MSNLVQKITAPNGLIYEQPLGLFINNRWMTSSNGQKIVSINPTYVSQKEKQKYPAPMSLLNLARVEPSLRLFQSMPPRKKTLIQRSAQPAQPLRARRGVA